MIIYDDWLFHCKDIFSLHFSIMNIVAVELLLLMMYYADVLMFFIFLMITGPASRCAFRFRVISADADFSSYVSHYFDYLMPIIFFHYFIISAAFSHWLTFCEGQHDGFFHFFMRHFFFDTFLGRLDASMPIFASIFWLSFLFWLRGVVT